VVAAHESLVPRELADQFETLLDRPHRDVADDPTTSEGETTSFPRLTSSAFISATSWNGRSQ
jgi:hypothetical protein